MRACFINACNVEDEKVTTQVNATSCVKPPIPIDQPQQTNANPFPAHMYILHKCPHTTFPLHYEKSHRAASTSSAHHAIWTQTTPNSLDIGPSYWPYLLSLSLHFSTSFSQPAVLQGPQRDIDIFTRIVSFAKEPLRLNVKFPCRGVH